MGKKKGVSFDQLLGVIHRNEIKLNKNEVLRTNKTLKKVTDKYLTEFQKDKFFKSIFQRYFYGGSYFDGLKVGKPDEFDIDLVFVLPEIVQPTIITNDNDPGYVRVKLTKLQALKTTKNDNLPSYEEMKQLVDEDDCLAMDKIKSWFQSKVDTANNATKNNKSGYSLVKTSVGGLAITFTVRNNSSGSTFDVDFVPSFKFSKAQLPSNCKQVHGFNRQLQLTQEFFVTPRRNGEPTKSFSFQGLERTIIHDKYYFKPALRLLKLFRDKHNGPIKSYFIKTIGLWALEDPNFSCHASMTKVFIQLLDKMIAAVQTKKLLYYWNDHYNLLEGKDPEDLKLFLTRLEELSFAFKVGDGAMITKLFKSK